MKILITGGAGFIGSHLTDRLIEEGNEAAVIDNLSTGKIENLNPEAAFYNVDIGDQKIKEIFEKEKPEMVFHLAAQIDVRKSVADPLSDAKVNILGSINLLHNAKMSNVKKFIFISTGGAIYGEADTVPTPESYREFPLSPYGIAKLSVEKYLNYYHKVFGLKCSILRLANVYGPRQNSRGEAGVVAIFCDKIITGKTPVIYGSGKQTRDFVYVKDVVDACVKASDLSKNSIYNIGTGIETNINQIFEAISSVSGYNIPANYEAAKEGEQQRSCLDISKAAKELGWQPKYKLQDGIKETFNWFKNR